MLLQSQLAQLQFKVVVWDVRRIIKFYGIKLFICHFFNLKNLFSTKSAVLNFVSPSLMFTWPNEFDQILFKYLLKRSFAQKFVLEQSKCLFSWSVKVMIILIAEANEEKTRYQKELWMGQTIALLETINWTYFSSCIIWEKSINKFTM